MARVQNDIGRRTGLSDASDRCRRLWRKLFVRLLRAWHRGQLRKIPATADVVVSLENKLVILRPRDSANIAGAELRKAVTDAGCDLKPITQRNAG